MVGSDGNQHRGELSTDDAIEGIRVVHRNARRLAEDARLLLQTGRLPSACSLALLSIEEVGKKLVIAMIASREVERRLGWRAFYRHRIKNVYLSFRIASLLAPEALAHEVVDRALRLHEKYGELFDQLKQRGLFVDCEKGPKWIEPTAEFDAALAEELVTIAEALTTEDPPSEIDRLTGARPWSPASPSPNAELFRSWIAS